MQQRGLATRSSYVVIDTEVVDQEAFSEFFREIGDAVSANGGTFLVRSADIDVIEGDWSPQRIAIMAFDSDDGATKFIRSSEYAAIQELRHRTVRSKVVVVEGYVA